MPPHNILLHEANLNEEDVRTAPSIWRYSLFPLQNSESEIVSLNWVTSLALQLVSQTESTGDHTFIAPVLHWAHILKAEQGPNGDWSAEVNVRTGEELGIERTCAPVELLQRLASLLKSSEFDLAISFTRALHE